MRILERVFVFQAVAEHAVEAGKLRRSGIIIDSGSGFYQPRRGCNWFGASHAILSGFGNGLATSLESSHPVGISSPNPPQMRVLERVFVLQAVAEHAVKAGVSEQDRPGEHQPRDGE